MSFLITRKTSMIVRNLQDGMTYYTEEGTKKGLECGGRDAWTRNEIAVEKSIQVQVQKSN
jgi:hypothetical protein